MLKATPGDLNTYINDLTNYKNDFIDYENSEYNTPDLVQDEKNYELEAEYAINALKIAEQVQALYSQISVDNKNDKVPNIKELSNISNQIKAILDSSSLNQLEYMYNNSKFLQSEFASPVSTTIKSNLNKMLEDINNMESSEAVMSSLGSL